MGLGKTIQALALMATRRSVDRKCKTTLIVAPVSLLKQWEREIQKKLKPGPRHSLTTFILHGEKRHATFERLRTYDVVLTTYGEQTCDLLLDLLLIELRIHSRSPMMLTDFDRHSGLGTETTR